jgi:hypothetical protein
MIQRLMLVLAVGSSIATAASCSPCVSTGAPADAISPVQLVDGGLGDPCSSTGQCSAGLECFQALAQTDSYAENVTFRACTQVCDGTRPCPQGSVCADSTGQPSAAGYCVPGCQADADCRTGKRAGTCVGGPDAGVAADGGVRTGACQSLVCPDNACPSGYLCQNWETFNRGSCGTGASGVAAPPPNSWCGKAN